MAALPPVLLWLSAKECMTTPSTTCAHSHRLLAERGVGTTSPSGVIPFRNLNRSLPALHKSWRRLATGVIRTHDFAFGEMCASFYRTFRSDFRPKSLEDDRVARTFCGQSSEGLGSAAQIVGMAVPVDALRDACSTRIGASCSGFAPTSMVNSIFQTPDRLPAVLLDDARPAGGQPRRKALI